MAAPSLRLFLLLLGFAELLPAQCFLWSVPMGSGCGPYTPWGIPVIQCAGAPTIGSATFGFTTTAPCLPAATTGLLLVGTCLAAPVIFTSGFGPGGLCGPSQAVCAQYVDIAVILAGTPQSSGFAFTTPVPYAPPLIGLQLCVQGANWCPGVPCLAVTNAVRVVLQ